MLTFPFPCSKMGIVPNWKSTGGYILESEITYEYKDFLEGNMKFTAYRNTVVNGKSLIHKHNFLELIYIISGNATHYIDNTEYKVSKGDLLLIDTNQTHFHKSENGVLYANMVLLPEFISENLIYYREDSEDGKNIFKLHIIQRTTLRTRQQLYFRQPPRTSSRSYTGSRRGS